MGRYSVPLAPHFAVFTGIEAGMSVLDAGCGPGALTTELAHRVGAERVTAVDPAEHFVEVCRSRVPGAEVRRAAAEELPFADGAFDAALAQLVVSFMQDAEAGAGELRRVVRPGGLVAACMWAAGEMELLGVFWDSVAALGDAAPRQADLRMRFRTREELHELAERAGLEDIRTAKLSVRSEYESFDELWRSLPGAAGPVGAFYASLAEDGRERLHAECRRRLGDPPGSFALPAAAWAVSGRTPAGGSTV